MTNKSFFASSHTLLTPRAIAFRAMSRSGKNRFTRWMLLGSVGLSFWTGIFLVSLRVLSYFQSIEELGNLLAFKLLSMILITFFSLQIFSSILTALSKLYLSRDLALVHSMPVGAHTIFFSRWIESTIDSSWMVVIFTLPIFLCYGVVFKGGILFYGVTGLILILLSVIASLISTLFVMIAVNVIPAHRIRGLFIFMGLSFFIVLFFAFRMLKPERMVDPESFVTVLTYLKTLKTPNSIFIPSTWAFDAIYMILNDTSFFLLVHIGLLVSFSLFLLSLAIILSNKIYAKGYSKSQTSTERLFKSSHKGPFFLRFLKGPVGAFAVKEVRSFFRDQSQWSQLFLIGALVVIYVYNFKVLPLEKAPIQTIYLQNLLSFLNLGLASFVLIAITGRFSFPAVSMESESFWIVKSSPISMRQFLWVKYGIYVVPLFIIAETLVIVTNILLNVSNFMMGLSVITMMMIVPGVVAMGIGMGAIYPNFKSENPAQTLSSFGGLLFMLISAIYIALVLILEAGPVYMIFMSQVKGKIISQARWVWIIFSFSLAFLLNILAVILPMRHGEQKLKEY